MTGAKSSPAEVVGGERAFMLLASIVMDDGIQDLTFVRNASAQEVADIEDAHRRLNILTEGSPYARLAGYGSDLHAAINELARVISTTSPLTSHAMGIVKRRFADYLASFRAFLDQTALYVSRNQSDASGEKRFDLIRRSEYDRNLAYRVCYQLRNASSHAGDVLNTARIQSRLSADGGQVFQLNLDVDGPKIVSLEGARIKAPVRAELLALTKPLPVLALVHEVQISCERIYAEVLAIFRDDCESLIERTRLLHVEADSAVPGAQAVLVPGDAFDARRPKLDQLFNPWPLADLLRTNLAETARILERENKTIVTEEVLSTFEPLTFTAE